MELGLVVPHTGPMASPTFVEDFVLTAESCGIDRLWAVDHLVLPHRVESPYVSGRQPVRVADGWLSEYLAPSYESLTTLAWIAGRTTRIGLGTSVAALPLRNPICNARQLATLDALSGGRVVYGAGIGWMREEAVAMGLPWDHRATRSEEHIALLRHLWSAREPLVSFHGQYFSFSDIDPSPFPCQRPIPILIGEHSAGALARAVRVGDGWIAGPMPPERLAGLLATLRRLAEEQGRDADDLLVVASTVAGPDVSPAFLSSYRDVGVHHLQLVLPVIEPRAALCLVERIAAWRD
ncbi:TIGR03619 family F420-dependent LLM class oxidoreductase [Mycolicibacterium sp. 120266]|uniref:TIGR03619 family F420-dependent LLM class oxidoreductase n=1 Tax=Mycolicibacterium sp. 120266 TaxID=3090601 RepID=UPI00299CF87B|nr:TIGR03619 family F420-dependent LLM class oxidoreductase [Mycolicibacterium sp. 120266]MDX1873863.1 TIGR03619 family F420-dependent LLM class oxidoreductase [Mycolicibacterium sp. 120266]